MASLVIISLLVISHARLAVANPASSASVAGSGSAGSTTATIPTLRAGFGNFMSANTTTSSCTWKKSVNASSSTCTVAARTCYECLNVAPTTEKNCVLTPTGLCMSISAYDPTQDYRRIGASSAWPPHLNYFPSTNTTYCAPDDHVCTICRSDKFPSTWQSNPSQYCEGIDRCVCMSICEVEQWESSVQSALVTELARENAAWNATNCTLKPVSLADNSSSGSVDLSEDSVVTKAVLASTDPCMWYQNETYCGSPRTCSDCLNNALINGARCVLHASGYCASMSTYSYSRDFRRNHSSTEAVLFPSTNTTYCGQDDVACAKCRATSFKTWTNASGSPLFCTGTDNCVCLASCEVPTWKQNVVGMACSRPAIADQTDSTLLQFSKTATILISVLTLTCGIMCMWMLAQKLRAIRRRRAMEEAMERWRHRSPKGPRLQLDGWNAMLQELIDTERATAQQDEDGEITVNPNPLPSAPPNSGRLVVVAPSIVVDEDEAYRPVSPNRTRG